MDRGYIKLWRKIDESSQYHSEPFDKTHAWMDLLILANHKKRVISMRGVMLTIDRGEVLAGERFLGERWGWSRGKVRRYLEFLEKTVQQIVQQKNNVCSIISITNWEKYQGNGTADSTTDSTTDGPQTVPQTDTPKNVKNDKNVKNICSPIFEELWNKYPKRIGKKHAKRHFESTVKTEEDVRAIQIALNNYLSSERVMKGFIQNGSTWFNQWQDWVEFKEEICPKCKNKGKYISSTGYEIVCDCPRGKA